jgi:hypothetical protein
VRPVLGSPRGNFPDVIAAVASRLRPRGRTRRSGRRVRHGRRAGGVGAVPGARPLAPRATGRPAVCSGAAPPARGGARTPRRVAADRAGRRCAVAPDGAPPRAPAFPPLVATGEGSRAALLRGRVGRSRRGGQHCMDDVDGRSRSAPASPPLLRPPQSPLRPEQRGRNDRRRRPARCRDIRDRADGAGAHRLRLRCRHHGVAASSARTRPGSGAASADDGGGAFPAARGRRAPRAGVPGGVGRVDRPRPGVLSAAPGRRAGNRLCAHGRVRQWRGGAAGVRRANLGARARKTRRAACPRRMRGGPLPLAAAVALRRWRGLGSRRRRRNLRSADGRLRPDCLRASGRHVGRPEACVLSRRLCLRGRARHGDCFSAWRSARARALRPRRNGGRHPRTLCLGCPGKDLRRSARPSPRSGLAKALRISPRAGSSS